MSELPALLVALEFEPDSLEQLASAFTLHQAATRAARAALLPQVAPFLRAVLTNGTTGFTAAEIAMLPQLEIICALGVGYEGIDLDAARARGITVTHGPGVNGGTVADHAMALLLAAVRNIPAADAAVRRGEWDRVRHQRPSVSGRRLGILGMGAIGEQIAQRAAAGFDMAVAYHNRRRRDELGYHYCASPVELAAWADFLVVATPGGRDTAKLVDAPVLAALGADGFLVNIARGSVVDTAALVDALERGRIAGAGLDVVDGEPNVPEPLRRMTNVVFTPHVAGRSPEAVRGTVDLVMANLRKHFAGQPVLTPIPNQ